MATSAPSVDEWIALANQSSPDASQSGGNPAPIVPVQTAPLAPVSANPPGDYNTDLSALPQHVYDHWAAVAADGGEKGGFEDALHSLPVGLAKGIAGLAGLPGDVQHMALDGEAAALKFLGADPARVAAARQAVGQQELAGSGVYNHGIQDVAGHYYQPQTAWGRGAETAGEFAPAALLPGSLAARAARTLIPAGLSDGAGEAARAAAPDDPSFENWARIGGALAGGVGQGVGEAIANAPQRAISGAVRSATPQQFDDMQRLMASARNLPGGGVQVSPFEAGAQVGVPQLAKVQHFLENTPQGGEALSPFFAQRPGQVANVTGAIADQFAPPTSNPSMLGVHAKGAADEALGDVRKLINARAEPFYDALKGQEMAPEQYAPLAENQSYAKALEAFRSNPELSAPYAGLPDHNLAVVNEVQKQLGTMADQARPGEFNPEGNHQLEAVRGNAKKLGDALARSSSADYAIAHDVGAQGRQLDLAPLQAGPLGTMARTADVPEQTTALFRPRNVGGASETVDALGRLSAQDPNLPGQLTGQYLRNSADSAFRNLQGGANEWGGAKLGVQIAGTPETREALLSGAHVANPDAAATLSDALEAFSATGKRLPVGSRTYFNEELGKQLGIPTSGFSSWTDPLTYGHMLNNAVGGALYRRKIGALADMLVDPELDNQMQFMRSAAAARPTNPALTAALLAPREGDRP